MAVAIAIYVQTFDRNAGFIVNLFVNEEGIGRMTDTVDLDGITDAPADAAGEDAARISYR